MSDREMYADAYRAGGFSKLAELHDTGRLGTVEVFGRSAGRILLVTDAATGRTIPVFLGLAEVDRLVTALTDDLTGVPA
jgi:hypothetical protein